MPKKKPIIEEEEYPSNSIASRTAPMREQRQVIDEPEENEPVKQKRVVRASAMIKKKTFVESVASIFVGDAAKNVINTVVYDVLLPAAKSMIQDGITSAIDMALFGNEGAPSRRSSSRDRRDGRTIVSYGSFYQDESKPRSRKHVSPRDRFDLESIYFRHGTEANEVLEAMGDQLEQFGVITVAEYFDLAGIDGATWAHTNYGWKDLGRAYCSHTRNGYTIVLPTPQALD